MAWGEPKNVTRIEKGKKYKASNGNIGIFKGTWMTSAKGIIYVLEDEEGHCVGYLNKNNVKYAEVEEEVTIDE